MNPDTLLTELKTRGIALRVAGDRLMVSDPDNGLTPGLRALISRHKPALIERLPLGVMNEPARPAAEQRMIAILDQWEIAGDPLDPKWARQYAAAAIAAGAACYDEHGTDLGAAGWQAWLN